MVDRHKLTVFYLKSFDMDSVQVGKAVFGKEIHTTLGIEPRTNSNPGRYGNPYSVCWFKKNLSNKVIIPCTQKEIMIRERGFARAAMLEQ